MATELRQLAWWETIQPEDYFRHTFMPTEPKQVCLSVGWTVEYAFYYFKERGMTTLFYRPIDSHPQEPSDA